jgi:hypothetical protein
MSFDLTSAAAATGVAKSSVLRTIKAERISGQRDDNGRWHIEPVELFKIFPPLPPTQPATRDERHPSRPPRSIIAVQLCELRAGRLPRPQTGSVVASNRVLLVGTSRIVVGVFADANAPVNEGRGAP